MKKGIIAVVISLLVNGIGMYVNYRAFQQGNYLKWCVRRVGGEITIENGFGWQATHIYPMLPDEEVTHTLRFRPVSFLMYVVAAALMIYVVLILADKLRAKMKKF
ncbi:MAG: hypothetical protein IJV50_02670 [Lachnospiraceae bacterium]|nr:hypothetical protein [Lachnospiraceae bacterium]